MADAAYITDLRARIQRAKDAYESMMLGGKPRAITDSNGEKVEYAAANPSGLLAYIRTLEAELAGLTGQCSGLGSLGMFF